MTSGPSDILQLWPLLFVRDIGASVEFYTEKLGFTLAEKAESDEGELYWCHLERGGVAFMLQQVPPDREMANPPAPEVVFYFVCDDADGLYAEFSARGVDLEPPAVTWYGMKQLSVPDPDGYEVCFESLTERSPG